MPLARADLESLLRARKLDRTLTTSLPSALSPDGLAPDGLAPDELAAQADIAPPDVVAATDLPLFDARLGGGFPRGHLSELVGQRSSGRTSVLLQTLAAAPARGALGALLDTRPILERAV